MKHSHRWSRRKALQLLGGGVLATALPSRLLRAADELVLKTTPFTLGVASGYPTPSGVVLWTRLAPSLFEPGNGLPANAAVPVRWEIATDAAMKQIVASGTEYATPEWAHSVHVESDGLEPAREYWYRFTAAGHRSPIGHTRTAPRFEARTASLKLAIASCQQYEQGYFVAYRHMSQQPLDLIVHVGDYIYEKSWGRNLVRRHNAPEAFTLEDYRNRHALYRSDADLQAAHAHCPWLVTWDDHEVANDYANAVSEDNDEPELFLARRAAAYRAYYEHMPLPRRAVPFGASMRLYTQRLFGDLASLYLLDGRQYRDVQACAPLGERGASIGNCEALRDARRSYLGSRQEEWLVGRLAQTRTRWNLLAQGTVVSYMDEQPGAGERFWTDAWNGYPAARDRLISALVETKTSNPVLLGGDIHAFIASNLNYQPHNPSSPIVAGELVTTSITSQPIDQAKLERLKAENPNLLFANSESRGYVAIELTREALRADLIAMDTVTQETSGARILRSFASEHGKPGLTGE
jgi:alkaline phosphatase D